MRIVWKKRIRKIFLVLILFSFLSYLQQIYLGNESFDFIRFIKISYASNWNGAYGYLYSFLSFLISLPLLRKFVHNLEKIHFYYMIGLALFFCGVLPVIEYRLWNGDLFLNSNVGVGWLTNSIVLYPCIGYFLEHKLVINKATYLRKLPVLWGINLLCIGISCYMTHYKVNLTGICLERQSQTFHSSFVLINCITIYITLKTFMGGEFQVPRVMRKGIISVGRCTFGIYLFHIIIMRIPGISQLWIIFRNKWNINYMLSSFLFCFVVMVIGYLLTMFCKRIFILKKLF